MKRKICSVFCLFLFLIVKWIRCRETESCDYVMTRQSSLITIGNHDSISICIFLVVVLFCFMCVFRIRNRTIKIARIITLYNLFFIYLYLFMTKIMCCIRCSNCFVFLFIVNLPITDKCLIPGLIYICVKSNF